MTTYPPLTTHALMARWHLEALTGCTCRACRRERTWNGLRSFAQGVGWLVMGGVGLAVVNWMIG